MPTVEVDKLIDLVRKSELVTDERLDATLERVRAERGDLPEAPADLAKTLIEAELLTPWQAEKLLAGKHKGFRLGKYKLLGAIGKGGMSHVYLAEHVLMRRRVAIKVLPKQRVKDRSYLSRFQLEARAAARLDDPNIVRVYDIDNDGDTHYIVMEYVDGRDLHQTVAQDGPLPYETAADYIAQVARGLEHAHQMGLVHRDIKPANCLVDPARTVKLLDMGLAKLTDDEASLTLANDENVLGTADYLAPEQALDSHSADARADIYSLGCTLYFLLTGRPPFPEGTISERLLKHQVEQPESILKARPDCPLSLVDICTRMMAKKPDERPQTAGAVADALADWLGDRGYRQGPSARVAPIGSPPSADGSGVGSGILSRYTQLTPPPGGPGGSKPGGLGRGRGLSSGGLAASSAETRAGRQHQSSIDTDEDIGLAPLEDDKEPDSPSRRNKKASASSGVLSDESGPKLGAKAGGSTSAHKGDSSKTSLSSPSGPPKSIFDEVYAKQDYDPIAARAAKVSDYDPLHPPGYVNPYKKTPWYVWAGAAAGVLLVVVVVFQLLAS